MLKDALLLSSISLPFDCGHAGITVQALDCSLARSLTAKTRDSCFGSEDIRIDEHRLTLGLSSNFMGMQLASASQLQVVLANQFGDIHPSLRHGQLDR